MSKISIAIRITGIFIAVVAAFNSYSELNKILPDINHGSGPDKTTLWVCTGMFLMLGILLGSFASGTNLSGHKKRPE